jgi:hypothetical protein
MSPKRGVENTVDAGLNPAGRGKLGGFWHSAFIYGLQGEMLLPSGLKPWFKRLETARLKPRPLQEPYL